MYIKVNDIVFNDSVWNFNMERGEASLTLNTDDSIANIASIFDGDDVIRAYDDNDNETGVWYVHHVMSIYVNYESKTPEEPRQVVVSIKASALTTEAEAALGGDINQNMEAILELAELISDLKDFEARISLLEGKVDGIPNDLVSRFSSINDIYNALADRVAKLENASH